ncbi:MULTISPECIES: NAD(P)-dependent oxidoreductase [unclassified Pseudomonas]|uniref:NAD(P)-dependent oxidoreductase n=1 Tax=unclassified Pseudomonas TaxID=196821 RepID=UPI0035BF3C21
MSQAPILLLGGTGAIGHRTITALRAAHPDIPLLLASRDIDKAHKAAEEVGNAQGVVIDTSADDLGLGDQPVSAVLVLYMDHTLASLRFSQARGIPHLSISSGVFEIAPQIAQYMHKPNRSAIVLGYEWMVGATTVATLHIAKAYRKVHDIRIHALVDDQDTGGPTVATDFEHLNKMLPAALTRQDNAFIWREGEEAKVSFCAVDGTEIDANGFSSIDVTGLAAATDSENVQFNMAIAVSSTRRSGLPMSTEILIELAGEGANGEPMASRHALIHPAGAAALTGLSIAMLLERLIGLDGQPLPVAGLYFPYQLLDAATYLKRLGKEGGELRELEPVRVSSVRGAG